MEDFRVPLLSRALHSPPWLAGDFPPSSTIIAAKGLGDDIPGEGAGSCRLFEVEAILEREDFSKEESLALLLGT